eukprot:Plantae.Rhodophyta-Palmaria_palmata.ctg22369.p2 GENE.Plantae.Rhodophyta-Palmaria_palmata.ctg22369~~Plantae.Rhodophyta-Palmaria_palmata.ctg22369.p2  ORF type:complete len:110 (-),score=3.18 Plantae.Rhodophyta-Palmaria_palmata.ctg22369:5-334(-)
MVGARDGEAVGVDVVAAAPQTTPSNSMAISAKAGSETRSMLSTRIVTLVSLAPKSLIVREAPLPRKATVLDVALGSMSNLSRLTIVTSSTASVLSWLKSATRLKPIKKS